METWWTYRNHPKGDGNSNELKAVEMKTKRVPLVLMIAMKESKDKKEHFYATIAQDVQAFLTVKLNAVKDSKAK